MQTYLVQVILGQHFADLSVVAKDDAGALAAARALVKSDDTYKLFRHRFANFVL